MLNSVKKINKALIMLIALNVLFVFLIGYEFSLLNNLYNDINESSLGSMSPHGIRVNFSGYAQAIQRYQNSLLYAPPAVTVSDPFSNPVQVSK